MFFKAQTMIQTYGEYNLRKLYYSIAYSIILKIFVFNNNYNNDSNRIKSFGFTEAEAPNILEGKNPDGTKFEKLPF